jgi:chemosensory pili system protein ChpA (sensor histidine kinase/response regulator)
MMAESVNDVATVQRNLLRAMEGAEDDLIAQGRQAREAARSAAHPHGGVRRHCGALVRRGAPIAKETGKQIKLDITGGSIEMDRGCWTA